MKVVRQKQFGNGIVYALELEDGIFGTTDEEMARIMEYISKKN